MTKMKNTNKKFNNQHKKIDRQFSGDNSLNSGIKTVIVVVVIFIVFYLLTVFILNKKSSSIVTNDASIQYTKILAGESFNQNASKYLVFFYDSSSSDASNYIDLVSKYREKDKHLDIYTVDLHEGMNKKYVSTDENLDVDKVSDLRVKGPTIIYLKDKEIIDYTTSSFSDFLDNNVK